MPIAIPKGTPPHQHRTKQEFVYRTLRNAIMRCELRPGERLVIDDLARRLGVSIIPVREALQMLQSEALVIVVPHVGATVAPISRQSILDVFTVMEGLEIVATRLVAERATPEDLETLRGLVRAMDEALAAAQHEEWADLNTRFHRTIGSLPGLDMLDEMTARVVTCWDRVRRFYFRGVLLHRVEQAQHEHHAILDAIEARDLASLEALVRRHNQGALTSYLTYVNEHTEGESPA
jgi:DNA-binding GntR family transcriptional regulator